jgi:cephalosporin hydroxylase
MKIHIDTSSNTLCCGGDGAATSVDLYSDRGFEILSDLWLKVGWNQKYPYTFSWFGRPIIQAPEDIVRTQEVFWQVKPTVVIETGVAHGGSLIYSASLMKAMGIKGRVVGIDIEIRPHNRRAIEEHPLSPIITLIEGSSTSPEVVAQAKEFIKKDDHVMVILDSCHTKAHVVRELELYHPFVTPGSYIVATDGSMRDLHDVPRGNPDWTWNHPAAAAEEFAAAHPDFSLEQPPWPFNESALSRNITLWPSAWLRKNS